PAAPRRVRGVHGGRCPGHPSPRGRDGEVAQAQSTSMCRGLLVDTWQRAAGHRADAEDMPLSQGALDMPSDQLIADAELTAPAVTSYDVLQQLRSLATSTADKGTLFERLCRAWFRTDPMWVDQFDTVWM